MKIILILVLIAAPVFGQIQVLGQEPAVVKEAPRTKPAPVAVVAPVPDVMVAPVPIAVVAPAA